MNKIKILQFPIANSNGGITHYALNNWKWMDKSKFECDFATMSKSLDFENKVLETGSKIHYISCYAEENQKQFIKEFREILRQGNYDVVHLHTKQWKSLTIEELCREEKTPRVIVHAHNTGIDVVDEYKRQCEIRTHEEVKRKFNEKLATDFWACSELAADFLFGNQISKDKIVITPNAIELDKFAFNYKVREQYRQQYGLENCFVIGHVGRFEYPKNHEFLINVFYEVSRTIDSARLILLGDGQLFSEIKQKVKNLGLEEKVIFGGAREDIHNWYYAMDVFCLPSRFEGLGIALIEAQASGLPCVVSEFIPQEAKHSQEITSLSLNAALWHDTILKKLLLQEEDARLDRSRKNIIELRKEGYDMKKQIENIEQLYIRGGGGVKLSSKATFIGVCA